MILLKIVIWLYRKHIYVPTLPENINTPIGAIDAPSPFEKIAPKPAFDGVKMPRKFSLREKAKKFGWKIPKQSKNSCTAYMRIICAGIQNTIWNGVLAIFDGEAQWREQEKTGGDRKWGDTLQNAWVIFKKFCQGFPETENRRISLEDMTVDVFKKWLLLHRPIGTGVRWKWLIEHRMDNCEYMIKTSFYVPADGKTLSGHALTVTGWDDDKGEAGAFELVESELMQCGMDLPVLERDEPGVCWIEYKYIKRLMSCYISFDAIDKEYLVRGKEFAVSRVNGKVVTV
jgi:hypothetical protein